MQVVAALQGADDSSSAMRLAHSTSSRVICSKRFFGQIDLRQRIIAMGVETGGNQQHLGLEFDRAPGSRASQSLQILVFA